MYIVYTSLYTDCCLKKLLTSTKMSFQINCVVKKFDSHWVIILHLLTPEGLLFLLFLPLNNIICSWKSLRRIPQEYTTFKINLNPSVTSHNLSSKSEFRIKTRTDSSCFLRLTSECAKRWIETRLILFPKKLSLNSSCYPSVSFQVCDLCKH